MNPLKNIAALLLLSASTHAATYPIVYAFTNQLWYTNSAADPKTVVSVVVQTTGAVQNAMTISTFRGGQSNLSFSVDNTTNFRAAVWASATNDYAVKLFTGDRLYIAQTFTNRAFATISLLTSPDSSSGGGSVRVIASGVTNSSAGAIILTGDAVGLHTQSGSNSIIVLRANPTNMASERATVNELDWDGTIFTSPENFRAGYLNAVGAGSGTDPGDPKGYIVLVKSGSGDDYTVSTRYIYGVNGTIVTNDANGNTVVDGGSTGTVSAFFPRSNTNGTGRLYFSMPASPNNYSYIDLRSTNSGLFGFDGTNLYLGSVLLSTASNTVLFNGFAPAYYQDAQRLTNLVVMEEGATIATSLLGINGGTNVTLSMETWTNSSGTVGQRVTISAGSGGSNYLLNSVNTWTESNAFQKTVVAPQITLNGSGRTMSGLNATVGIRGTNLTASGSHSTAAGGRSSTASGDDSTVSGGNANTASGSASAIGGGNANTASGLYSTTPGGFGNTASGDYSLAALLQSTASGPRSAAIGTYLNAAGTDTVVFGIGQASTNPLTRYGPRRVYIDSYQTNMGLSVATTNATHAVEVGGTVRATAFIGDGSLLTALPSGSITGVETAVVYTNFDLLYVTNKALRLYLKTDDDAVIRQDPLGFTNSGGVRLTGPITLGGAYVATSAYSFASGFETVVNSGGPGANASGYRTIASGLVGANANGLSTTASGDDGANANGRGSVASGDVGANANGHNTTASGVDGANANGVETVASGDTGANANGVQTVASGDLGASANGYGTTASGDYSMAAGGMDNVASGDGSFAAGVNAVASNTGSFVWSDHNEGSSVGSPMANTFTVRATNGWYSTQDTSSPALVIRGNTHYGDGSGLTNIAVSGDGGATGFVFSGLSGAYDPVTRTLGLTNTGGSGGVTPTSTYGVAIVGASSNVFIVDPGSASNLVLMSSGAGHVPQFRAHPWASSGSLSAAIGSLSNAAFGQSFATSNDIVTAANSANATSLQGVAWSSATPSIGWFPIMTASGWQFTNAAPSSSTGSAVNSISAGTNTLYGNLVLSGTGNVTVSSTAAQDGTMVVGAGTWYTTTDANGQRFTNANILAQSLHVGRDVIDSGSNNVALVGRTIFQAGAQGNVSAGEGITFGNTVRGSFASGSNIIVNGFFGGAVGRDLNAGANYDWVQGLGNSILSGGQASMIGGGYLNTNEGALYATIGGGIRNAQGAAALYSYITGGATNRVDAIGGGAIGHSGYVPSTATNGLIINVGRTRETNALPHGITIIAPGTVVVKVGGMTFTVGTGTVSAAVGTGSFSFAESGLIVNGVLK